MSVQILIAIHNATPGTGTFALATSWAQRLNGAILAMGVVDESTAVPASVLAGGSASMGNIAVPDANALRTKAEKYVTEALRELESHCQDAGVACRHVAKEGNPEEAICLEAQRCDIVVLGRQSTPNPDFGIPTREILSGILRPSPRPVVAVPGHIQQGQGILVAYDGSLQSARALQALVATGLRRLGTILVVGVHPESEQVANEHAERAVEYLAAHGLAVDRRIVVSDKSVECVIADEVQAGGVEMIVMGAYGRSRLAEFFLGSTTTKVMDGVPAPVFLFH